jgi:pimeloyl-ACP methyl ester carboxylesterase
MSVAPALLVHAKLRVALHRLRDALPADPPAPPGATRALLLLHGLGERSPAQLPGELALWPGPVHALDFCGHGASEVPAGGGYTAEVLMGDADAALRQLGAATLVGRGIGAYVALLLAGARPKQVRGAILHDGPGLAGGGPRPSTTSIPWAGDAPPDRSPDPLALAELSRDVRPPEYAVSFAQQAAALSGLERPISLCTMERAIWLRAVAEEPGVEDTTLAEALAHYARVA